jgi:outer membrane receptor protein involved in Fe transport
VGSLTNAQLNIPVSSGGFVFSSQNGRPSAFFGLAGLNPTTGAPTNFYTNASGAPLTFDASGNLVTFNPGTPAGAVAAGAALVAFLPGSDTDTTRLMPGVISPSERVYFNGMGRYDLSPGLRAWTRFSYTQTEASFTGNAPLSSALGATALGYSQVYSTSNPFLTPATRAYFTANPTPFTGTSFYLNKEYTEVTDGRVDIDQDTWTFQAGLEGDIQFAGRDLAWDLTYSQGRTTRSNVAEKIITARLGFAQDAVYANPGSTAVLPTLAGLDSTTFTYDAAANVYRQNGTGNLITCRVRVTGAPAGANPSDVSTCAPFNPFGRRNPRDAMDYLLGEQFLRSEIEQQYVQGNISGDLFELPAGPFQFAAGFEYRKEDGSFDLDAATRTGLYFDGASGAGVEGGFDTTEVYTEVRVPVLDGDMVASALGARLIEKLEFEGAVRFMDNSLAGEDVTWTLGARLVVTPDVTIRGNRTLSVRQPAIAELFSGVEPRFTSITDPCAVGVIATGPAPANRRANCIQAVINSGLATTSVQAETFLSTFTTPLGGIPGTFAGNPALDSEEANSWTAGVVLTPRFLPGFSASIDWINIDIDNAITALAGGAVAANCYDAPTLSNEYCPGITRGPTFRIASFESFFDNVTRTEFAGLTLNARYAFDPAGLFGQDEGSIGDVAVSSTLFYLDHNRSGVAALTDNKGGVGFEEFRGQIGINYSLGDLGINWQTTYYDDAKIDPNSSAIFLFNDVESYVLNDVSIRYQITPSVRAQFVVNNVFDAEPPFNSFSFQYDRLGRRFMAGLNMSF